jgi:RNA polymerase sigma-70 factor (ECF subfamily)
LATDDGELVRQALVDRQRAFAALVDRYRDLLCGMAYHYLGSFEDAQDVAQEAFVYAYLHLRELRDPDKFAPWLRRMTMSLCADLLRRRGDRITSWEGGGHSTISVPGEPTPAASFRAPGEELERWATRMVVREALARLSEKTRLTVTLFYMGGYSHAEIAQFLGVPLNTVRSRLQHAKRRLREEMTTMVTDVLHEGRPDPRFSQRVVEEAIRRGDRASSENAMGDALRYYDEALTALETWAPSTKQRRLKMETLRKKGAASRFPRGFEEAVKLYGQSLALAETLGDRKAQAEKLLLVGVHTAEREEAERCYLEALRIYREIGDSAGQGECLFWLGTRNVQGRAVATGKAYYEEALPFLEAGSDVRLAATCRAILRLLTEVGDEAFATLLAWNASCDELKQNGGVIHFGRHTDIRHLPDRREMTQVSTALGARTLFAQIGYLEKFLDPTVAVGDGWSGDTWSYSSQPLQTRVTVRSVSERVTVPAGTFEHCLLTEQVTTESAVPDDAPAENRQANRENLCGTRQAWYAPGVGLVQLLAQATDGTQATLQLTEFSLQDESDDYLPLSIGNTWTYAWAELPREYVSRELYCVTAQESDRWYLESYGYLCRAPSASAHTLPPKGRRQRASSRSVSG